MSGHDGVHEQSTAQTKESERLFSGEQLRRLILPLMVEQLLAVAVGIADSIMVSAVSEEAMAAVSLVDNINVLLIGLFSALATGGAVVAGQYLGHKNREKACEAGLQLLVFVTLIAAVVMGAIYVGRGWILGTVFGKIQPDVYSYADRYLMVVMASIPFLALYNCGAALFRVQGNSKVSMKTSLLMNGINVAGNALCVYGLHMSVEGVAIPTLVSRIVAAIVIVWLLTDQKLTVCVRKPVHYRYQGKMVSRILQIGIPNGIENSMFQLGKIVLLSLISTFGTTAIAANAAANSLAAFEILPGQAIGLAMVTVVSQCVGAGDYEQVKYYTKKLMIYAIGSMIILNALIMLGLPWIMQMYHLSSQTAVVARKILILHGTCAMVIWPLSFTFPNALRAANDARYTMTVSILSMWFCRIVLGVIMGKYLGMGVFGTWVAMIIDWVVRSIFFLLRFLRGKWMEQKSLTD